MSALLSKANGNGSGVDAGGQGLRRTMVAEQIGKRGMRSPRALEAMERVPRHRFLPPEFAARADSDGAVFIGEGQTISPPYMVGAMTEAPELRATERTLEGGAGSGDRAAPFDAIRIAAAAPGIPRPLRAQRAVGGRMIIPVGKADGQTLLRRRRIGGEAVEEKPFPCPLVPLHGQFGWPEASAE